MKPAQKHHTISTPLKEKRFYWGVTFQIKDQKAFQDQKQKEGGLIPLNEILEGKHPQYQTFKLKTDFLS